MTHLSTTEGAPAADVLTPGSCLLTCCPRDERKSLRSVSDAQVIAGGVEDPEVGQAPRAALKVLL